MALYKAILAYDGTEFKGFQRQAAARTVQGEVEAALRRIGWMGKAIHAAGRTDTGVHAAGQVISFEFEWRHSPSDLLRAANAGMPPDAAFRQLEPAPEGFHPRYSAVARRYVYRLVFDPAPDPLRERRAWRVWPAPDPDSLDRAAALFAGEHDFSAFGRPPKPGGPTVRIVFESGWTFRENGAFYTIEGNAFLFRMVRRIVITQIDAAQGLTPLGEIEDRIAGNIPGMVQGLAPAQGLTLESVQYKEL
ncbi:MAG TPA: tRNA pseudouridine(38-40) synthase TruA [Anaerolineales bacterium]|nr:tRNA pseudouridine(38-40) synthase TruA [Anaerolineales bacterium]